MYNMPSHGSLTKAGKVRSQTPKVQGRERHHTIARVRNKSNYRKRFVLKRNPGQKWNLTRR